MILVIGPFPEPIDGCSFANFVLVSNFRKRNVAFETINTNSNVVSAKQGHSFSFRKFFSFLRTYLELYKIFYSDKVYTTPGQTFYGIMKYSPFFLLCIFLRKPYIIHLHGNYLGQEYSKLRGLKKIIFHFLISKAGAGIVLSNSLKCNFSEFISLDKVFAVNNFVEDNLLRAFLEIEDKPRDLLRILFLSNLIEEKGILDLLEACLILLKRKVIFKITIAGAFDEGLRSEVESLFTQLGASLEYLGVVKGRFKIDAFANSNVFILPTYYKMEGQPISLLEGLASKNIIVTTNHAGIPDIVSTRNGYFVDAKSPESIANVLCEISDRLYENLDNFSSGNYEYAKANFTEEIFTSDVLKVVDYV